MRALLQRRRKIETKFDHVVRRGEQCQTKAERVSFLIEVNKVERQIREVQQAIDMRRQKLGELLDAILVEMRCLLWAGAASQAGELAEAAREVARDLSNDKDFKWDILRERFERYQRRYHRESYIGKRDYLKIVEEILRVA
jgi:hypothetical protein